MEGEAGVRAKRKEKGRVKNRANDNGRTLGSAVMKMAAFPHERLQLFSS